VQVVLVVLVLAIREETEQHPAWVSMLLLVVAVVGMSYPASVLGVD
jgi:hypothetical protein